MKTFIDWMIDTVKQEDDINASADDIKLWIDGWAKELKGEGFTSGVHSGDCTKESHSCLLCYFEEKLREYYEYTRAEKAFQYEYMKALIETWENESDDIDWEKTGD